MFVDTLHILLSFRYSWILMDTFGYVMDLFDICIVFSWPRYVLDMFGLMCLDTAQGDTFWGRENGSFGIYSEVHQIFAKTQTQHKHCIPTAIHAYPCIVIQEKAC